MKTLLAIGFLLLGLSSFAIGVRYGTKQVDPAFEQGFIEGSFCGNMDTPPESIHKCVEELREVFPLSKIHKAYRLPPLVPIQVEK